MMYPLVTDLAAEDIPVAVTCRVLGFSRQAYYQWLERPVSDRDWADAKAINAIRDIHADDPEFGYRLIADELIGRGVVAGEERVWRLCHQEGIASTLARAKCRGQRPGPAVHDDLVERDFTADDIDEKWFVDITEHPTDEGKLYLCAVKDACSTRIVGYSMAERMTAELACGAVRNSVTLRRPRQTVIVHSDRGGQFRARKFTDLLTRYQLTGSMGRVATCADNAAMESFFALLQKNVLDKKRWTTREELRIAIITWIERTYHRRRRQRGLGRLTPIEFETVLTTAATAA
jgi:putative transposase